MNIFYMYTFIYIYWLSVICIIVYILKWLFMCATFIQLSGIEGIKKKAQTKKKEKCLTGSRHFESGEWSHNIFYKAQKSAKKSADHKPGKELDFFFLRRELEMWKYACTVSLLDQRAKI